MDANMPALQRYAVQMMKGPGVILSKEQAAPLLAQFLETARWRGWSLLAAAILPTHVHLILGVKGDPEPTTLLRDFKSYGSRCLNHVCGKPCGGSWWSRSGSARVVKTEDHLHAAMRYVLERQKNALLIWRGSL
ncbi:MAG: transposase [Gemmatales bacterium]|nr:transposase [Gemmatales bacterium]MDW8387262.1 transposase [Gemmatales bacterium]